jgi:hypothetical protein
MIWEENLTDEIVWYLPRLAGAWGGVAVALVLGRFLIPFLVLIWRPLKRDRRVLAGVCLLLLAASLLEGWWLVLRSRRAASPGSRRPRRSASAGFAWPYSWPGSALQPLPPSACRQGQGDCMAESGEGNPGVGFEPSDMNPKTVGIVAAGVAVWLLLIPFILALGYPQAAHDVAKAPTLRPPEPRLQIDEARDLRLYDAAKQARLSSYGWVDRGRGIVHIPIEEAMRRLADQGIPGWPGSGKAAQAR